MNMKKKIRVLAAKPGLDGHDRGIKVVAVLSWMPGWRSFTLDFGKRLARLSKPLFRKM